MILLQYDTLVVYIIIEYIPFGVITSLSIVFPLLRQNKSFNSVTLYVIRREMC